MVTAHPLGKTWSCYSVLNFTVFDFQVHLDLFSTGFWLPLWHLRSISFGITIKTFVWSWNGNQETPMLIIRPTQESLEKYSEHHRSSAIHAIELGESTLNIIGTSQQPWLDYGATFM
jgi:hypothetical protein